MNRDTNPSPQEQHELDLLAAELRDAMPVVPLSGDFSKRLEVRLQHSWTIKGAFERSGVIRLAAGLLVMTLAAAPVAAWVGLWPQQKKNPPAIGFELPQEVLVEMDEDGLFGEALHHNVVAPVDEFDEFVWTAERSQAVEQGNRHNRLMYAAATLRASGWEGHFPESWSPSENAQFSPWAKLWWEFGLRCQENDFSKLSPDFLRRCEDFLLQPMSALPVAEEIAARAAWTWVLRGEVAAAGSVELAWPGAPFVEHP